MGCCFLNRSVLSVFFALPPVSTCSVLADCDLAKLRGSRGPATFLRRYTYVQRQSISSMPSSAWAWPRVNSVAARRIEIATGDDANLDIAVRKVCASMEPGVCRMRKVPAPGGCVKGLAGASRGARPVALHACCGCCVVTCCYGIARVSERVTMMLGKGMFGYGTA